MTGRLASLARHPVDASRRAKLDRKISEKIVSNVNIPLYRVLTKNKIPGTKKTFADVAGGTGGWLGVMGKPGRVGNIKQKIMGRIVSRAIADNPELLVGYTIPVPYVGTAMTAGKKRLYNLVGAKTPAEVRQAMEARRRNKAMLIGAGTGAAATKLISGTKELTPQQKAKREMDSRMESLGRELQKIAQAQRVKRVHKPQPTKKMHKGQRQKKVHKPWKLPKGKRA